MADSKPCDYCGDTYLRHPSYSGAQWEASRYCSRPCSGAARRIERAPRVPRRHAYKQVDFSNFDEVTSGHETPCWHQRDVAPGLRGYAYLPVEGVRHPAHRVYYEHYVGPIPEGLQLDHLCRNRACVNPAHLEAVTAAENVRRGSRTKLTIEQVAEIRVSDELQKSLASRFGVSDSHISRIRSGQTWRVA